MVSLRALRTWGRFTWAWLTRSEVKSTDPTQLHSLQRLCAHGVLYAMQPHGVVAVVVTASRTSSSCCAGLAVLLTLAALACAQHLARH
jgi:hypothetical protein